MERVQSAYNRHLWLPLLVLATSLFITAAFARERKWELFALGALLVLFFAFVLCIQSLKITFSGGNIRILYVIGARDVIPVRRITSVYDSGSRTRSWPVYVICCPHNGRKPFFMNGEIPRTARTTKILRECGLIGQKKGEHHGK